MTPSIDIRNAIVEALGLQEDIHIAFLFGSAARNRLRPDSDVDIAVAGSRPLSIDEMMSTTRRLSQAVRREVDLVDLRVTEGLILREILTKGTALIVHDRGFLVALAKKVVYFSEDLLPYTQRLRQSRIERFIHA